MILIKKNNTITILDGNIMENNKDNGKIIIPRIIHISKELINILNQRVIPIRSMDY